MSSWLRHSVTLNKPTHSSEVKQFYCTLTGSLYREINILIQMKAGCVSTAAVFVFVGKRPFGVSLLYMGWDKHYGFQLYQSDPSGNYGGWKATCIGNNSAVSGTEILHS